MSRALLVIFIGAVLLTALILLALILGGDDLGETTQQVLLISTATAAASVLALTGEAGLRVPGTRLLGLLALAVTATAYVFVVSWILSDRRPSRDTRSLVFTLITMAGALGLTCSMLFIRLLEGWRIVRAATLFALAGLCGGLTKGFWQRGFAGKATAQFTGVFAILFVVGLVLLLVGRDQSRKAHVKEEGGLSVPRCPHCGEELPRDLADVFH